MKVLVTGAAGQLGGAIVREFARGHEVVALTRQQLDLTDHAAVLAIVSDVRPSVMVNCAAYNDVDGAEADAVIALNVNAFGVQSLARAAQEGGATLVHYSSDFVFDGTATEPYQEDQRPNPQGVYATSKLLGEWFTRDAPRHYVLRVESLFGGLGVAPDSVRAASKRQSSVDRIIDAIVDRREARVFVDRVVSPMLCGRCGGGDEDGRRAWRARRVVPLREFRDEHVVRAGSGSGTAARARWSAHSDFGCGRRAPRRSSEVLRAVECEAGVGRYRDAHVGRTPCSATLRR